MGLATRSRTRAAWVLLGLAAVSLLADGAVWWRTARTNAQIAAVTSGTQAGADAPGQPPELRFAQAYAQASAQAASGAEDGAINRYRALQSDPRVGLAARYNSANLLVRQAVALREGPQAGRAIAPLELAKEYYRDVLRDDPSQWDARYNLERAQRLLPDPEDDDFAPPGQDRNAERAATTMRGYSPGLP